MLSTSRKHQPGLRRYGHFSSMMVFTTRVQRVGASFVIGIFFALASDPPGNGWENLPIPEGAVLWIFCLWPGPKTINYEFVVGRGSRIQN